MVLSRQAKIIWSDCAVTTFCAFVVRTRYDIFHCAEAILIHRKICSSYIISISCTDTPGEVKQLVAKGVQWLNKNTLSGKYKAWNTFFSGSGKEHGVSHVTL